MAVWGGGSTERGEAGGKTGEGDNREREGGKVMGGGRGSSISSVLAAQAAQPREVTLLYLALGVGRKGRNKHKA